MDTDSGYGVGDSEEEILERMPSLRVEPLIELKMCPEALLNEWDVMVGDEDGDQKSIVSAESDSVSRLRFRIGIRYPVVYFLFLFNFCSLFLLDIFVWF